MTSTAPISARIKGWDRAAIIALGGAGCALSYDALQQMAAAIHVRGLLTYLFPLVIDGFIAYGVRALLVLKNALLRARLYVWTLFGTATAASIWANALHAVRLNQQLDKPGLQLGDTVVAVLSTIAPLALAGAVHLYILIARDPGDRTATDRTPLSDSLTCPGQSASTTVTRDSTPGQSNRPAPGVPVTGQAERLRLSAGTDTKLGRQQASQDRRTHRHLGQDNGRPGQPDNRASDCNPQDTATGRSTADSDRTLAAPFHAVPGQAPPSANTGTTRRERGRRTALSPRPSTDRRRERDNEELLRIAKDAVRAEDKLTRRVVADAIRGQQIPLSNDALTVLMVQLREQLGQPTNTS
ncbi:DUF2637 domain-containing protein [Streptomyces sp. NBC_00316]|uniref:DUF2637 domain-containing protein n=1 Tax=Streptomyces sp. NBC_00316 TaxID=2975710 RepID=UPI002E2D2AEB|nr:DUF2637 domain-containing protein [Streptomyces sp. NBC_00316]